MSERLTAIRACLDAVRADLDAATRGPWHAHGFGGPAAQEPELVVIHRGDFDWETVRDGEYIAATPQADSQQCDDARLIASTPDRLDRMERALRAVLELAEAVNATAIIPTSTPIMNAGYRAALGDVVTVIEEVLA